MGFTGIPPYRVATAVRVVLREAESAKKTMLNFVDMTIAQQTLFEWIYANAWGNFHGRASTTIATGRPSTATNKLISRLFSQVLNCESESAHIDNWKWHRPPRGISASSIRFSISRLCFIIQVGGFG